MTRAELKKAAKESLKGRWGTAIGMILLYQIIVSALSMVAGSIPAIGSIAVTILTVPLSFGFIGQMMKFARKEEIGMFDYFSIGFKNFGKAWSIVVHTLLKLLPVLIAYVVSAIAMGVAIGVLIVNNAGGNSAGEKIIVFIGITVVALIITLIMLIIKSYLYALTEYIGNDNLEMSGKEVVEKSKELMTGHRWELFVLELSFIGWSILSILTLGIGLLWLIPYMEVTTIKFYESVLGNSKNETAEVITNN